MIEANQRCRAREQQRANTIPTWGRLTAESSSCSEPDAGSLETALECASPLIFSRRLPKQQ